MGTESGIWYGVVFYSPTCINPIIDSYAAYVASWYFIMSRNVSINSIYIIEMITPKLAIGQSYFTDRYLNTPQV